MKSNKFQRTTSTYVGALIIIGSILLAACSGNSKQNQVEVIDYSELSTLPLDVDLEIKESKDYLPGQIADIIVTQNGHILVSDYSSISIEQFDQNGTHLARIAQEGGGPGELANYFSMSYNPDDTLVIRQQSSQVITYAPTANGTFAFSHSVMPDKNPRRFTPNGYVGDGKFLSTESLVIKDASRYFQNLDDYRLSLIAETDRHGEIATDSVHFLKVPFPHLSQIDGGIHINTIPYRNTDRIRFIDESQYMIARPDSAFFTLFNNQHQEIKRIPFNTVERPLSSGDIAYATRNIDTRFKSEITQRMHDVKPTYLKAWVTNTHIWLLTDTNEDGKEIVVLDMEGQAVGKLMLSTYDTIHHVVGNQLYSVYQSEEDGDLIRRYNVEL